MNACNFGAANSTATDVIRCCTFEAEVKGVMFYKGYLELNSSVFQRILLTRDYENTHHTKAYWVKLADTGVKLGHLSRDTAEAWYYVSKIPTVKYTG